MSMVQAGNMREQRDGGVQVIARAAKILRALAGHPDGLSLSQIAREVGLARSTVHRIVLALESENFTTPASIDGHIHIGPGLAPLAAVARHKLHAYLEQLSSEADETVDLAVMEADQVFFIDQVGARQRLRAVSTVGSSFPLHCTANGKALLAQLPIEQVEYMLPEQLEIFTPHTIPTRTQLLTELEHIRAEGIAYDREEHTEGICAVGATMVYTKGSLAAITIVLPSVRFYGHEQNFSTLLLATCERIKKSSGAM